MGRTVVTLIVIGLLATLGCGEDPLDYTQDLLETQKYEKVVEITDAAILADAKNVKAHLLKGRALLGLDEVEKAAEVFTTAVEVGGKSAAKKVEEFYLSDFRAGFENVLAQDVEYREFKRYITRYSKAVSNPEIVGKICGAALGILADRGVDSEKEDYEGARSAFIESRKVPAKVVDAHGASAVLQLAKDAKPGDEAMSRLATAVLELFGGTQQDMAALSEILEEKGLSDPIIARQTVESIRVLRRGFEAFAVEWGFYPVFSRRENPPPMAAPATAAQAYREHQSQKPSDPCSPLEYDREFESLAQCFIPAYIKTMPTSDNWGTEFFIESTGYSYIIISLGSDKMADADWFHDGQMHQIKGNGGEKWNFEADIVLANGRFLQMPTEVE